MNVTSSSTAVAGTIVAKDLYFGYDSGGGRASSSLSSLAERTVATSEINVAAVWKNGALESASVVATTQTQSSPELLVDRTDALGVNPSQIDSVEWYPYDWCRWFARFFLLRFMPLIVSDICL